MELGYIGTPVTPVTLYKRNAQGKPIRWMIHEQDGKIVVQYGLIDKIGHTEIIEVRKDIFAEIGSLIKAKRKEGYKAITDLYDNAPIVLDNIQNLSSYLDTYLPKYNTHDNGEFIPMLCKTLNDNKPFEKGSYLGQWKINGERCIITMTKDNGLFGDCHLHYSSREGTDWTPKLNYLDDILLGYIPTEIKEMMLEEGVGLDGELYIPGYDINQINSFIKNTELPQHYKLQFWLYDLCIENMVAETRQNTLSNNFGIHNIDRLIKTKEDHLNNTNRLVLLDNYEVGNITEAIDIRNKFINLGFEGLVIREKSTEYQFGGKRNNAMLKFKKVQDGLFEIVDIIPEGTKRANLCKFVLKNDINDELFQCTYNAVHTEQEQILSRKYDYLRGDYVALVEFRERSGVAQVPFHAKVVELKKKH